MLPGDRAETTGSLRFSTNEQLVAPVSLVIILMIGLISGLVWLLHTSGTLLSVRRIQPVPARIIDSRNGTVERMRDKLNETEAIDYLMSIIENSENISFRVKSIELISRYGKINDKVFRILENCLISDENPKIRAITAKIIFKRFFEQGLKSLQWTITHDNSSLVLKIIKDLLIKSGDTRSKVLFKDFTQRVTTISRNLYLDPSEFVFLLDLEVNLNRIKSAFISKYEWIIQDENMICVIRNNHIEELSLSLMKELPPSVELLRKLISLDLRCNHLTTLPDTISNLKNLTYLDLSLNDFTEFPKIINEIENLRCVNLSDNFLSEIPESTILYNKNNNKNKKVSK